MQSATGKSIVPNVDPRRLPDLKQERVVTRPDGSFVVTKWEVVQDNPYAPPPAKCHCEAEINICPLCVGGLMPLVYALVLYAIYDELGWFRSVAFCKYAVWLTGQFAWIALSVLVGIIFVACTLGMLYCSVALIWCAVRDLLSMAVDAWRQVISK